MNYFTAKFIPSLTLLLAGLGLALSSVNAVAGIDGKIYSGGSCHIGHYSGLVHLGREAMGANAVPVYAMPKMAGFLRENGPWNLLIELNNIDIVELENNIEIQLNTRLSVKPLEVPHRGEYTETIGIIINGPQRKILFIPDIDKSLFFSVVISE